MSDGVTTQTAVAATLPDATAIATDDAGASGHVQIVKLALSADGSAAPILADANGMEVQGAGVAGTPAGGVHSVQGVVGGTALPISAAALPLPSGAATSAKQDTAQTSLTSIDAKVPALGQQLAAASTPVVLTAAQLSTLTPPAAIAGFATSAKQDTAQTALDAIAASASVVDDWDESDRAKVSPIAGQAGVAGGAGAVSASTQRVIVATDQTAIPVTDNGGSLTVDGSVSVSGLVPGVSATSLGKAEDAVAADGDTGVMALAVRKDTAATTVGADGDYAPLEVDASGRLHVNVGTSALPTGAATLAEQQTQTASLSVIDDWDESDRAKVNVIVGSAGVDGNSGVKSAATLRVVLATDQPALTNKLLVTPDLPSGASTSAKQDTQITAEQAIQTSVQLLDDAIKVDDAAFTPGTTAVNMAGFQADESSTDSVDEGDAGAARMTLDRKQIVTQQPHTAGGLSTFMASGSDGSSILVATAQAIKASAGQLYGYYVYNPEAAVTFVHFYNIAAASVTVGTTAPLFTIAVPAGSAANLMFPHGVVFSNAGWSCAATTTAPGNTAPSTGVSLVAWYM